MNGCRCARREEGDADRRSGGDRHRRGVRVGSRPARCWPARGVRSRFSISTGRKSPRRRHRSAASACSATSGNAAPPSTRWPGGAPGPRPGRDLGQLRRDRRGQAARFQPRWPDAAVRVRAGDQGQPDRHLQSGASGRRRDDGAFELNAEGERGVIVNTASVAAFDGQIGQSAYAALQRHRRAHPCRRARVRPPRHPGGHVIAPGIFDADAAWFSSKRRRPRSPPRCPQAPRPLSRGIRPAGAADPGQPDAERRDHPPDGALRLAPQ